MNFKDELDLILTLYEQNCMRVREAPIDGEILAVSINHQLETALTSIINLVDKSLPEKRLVPSELDVENYENDGYNKAISDMRAIIRSNT